MRKRILLIFLCLLAWLSHSNSQCLNWEWGREAIGVSTSGADEGWAICNDPSGNVYATGAFSAPHVSFGSYTLATTGFSTFVVKYDAAGNVLWADAPVQTGYTANAGYSISSDPWGNVYVTGNFVDTITFGGLTLFGNSYDYNIFIVKYDTNGNVIWAKSAGGNHDDQSNSISIDALGNIYITGFFKSASINFGSDTLSNASPGSEDVFIAKYTNSGAVQWAKSAGGINPDIGNSISANDLGNIYVTGYFQSPTITLGSTILTNSSSSSFSDMFITKYDASGNVQWAKSATGTTSSDAGNAVTSNAAGNVYLTGQFGSASLTFDTITISGNGSWDGFIARYDPQTGNPLWVKALESYSAVIGNSVAADATGNVFVAGGFNDSTITFGSITLTTPPWPASIDPVFVVKYDKNGNALCGSTLVSGGDDQMGISTDNSNVYVAADFTLSPFFVGPDSLFMTGGAEFIFVAKLGSMTGISELNSDAQVSIYPNPSNGNITLEYTLNPTDKATLQLTDITGKEIAAYTMNTNTDKLQINNEKLIKSFSS